MKVCKHAAPAHVALPAPLAQLLGVSSHMRIAMRRCNAARPSSTLRIKLHPMRLPDELAKSEREPPDGFALEATLRELPPDQLQELMAEWLSIQTIHELDQHVNSSGQLLGKGRGENLSGGAVIGSYGEHRPSNGHGVCSIPLQSGSLAAFMWSNGTPAALLAHTILLLLEVEAAGSVGEAVLLVPEDLRNGKVGVAERVL